MTNIHYSTFGEGEIDILLVHGWASSSGMWDNVCSHIKNARFWALDFAGFGKTPMPEQAPTLDEHVRTLIHFCDEHVKPQMIIAHSMGGLITLKTLSIRPDLAQQLVLICPVVTGKFGVSGIPSNLLRNELTSSALRITEKLWPLIQQEYLVKLAVSTGHGSNPTLVQQITQDFLDTDPRAGIEALISMTQENMQPLLTEITQATLVCIGKGDLTVPPDEGRTAAIYMPNAELVTFEKSRHRPMDEEIEKFGTVFKEFAGRFGIECI
jgi:pimeloyl-ACP methyl ester carboxylesterase